MSLPVEPYLCPADPYLAAVHNGGHALGCIATGRPFRSVTAQMCQGNPLGLKRGSDLFGWAVICWAGPAAEAVAAFHSGTDRDEAARWMWKLYRASGLGAEAVGDYPEAMASDPAVIAVALSLADANWPGIERIATRLTKDAGSHARLPAIGDRELKVLIGSRDGADIGVPFEGWAWAAAVGAVKDTQSQGVGMRWP